MPQPTKVQLERRIAALDEDLEDAYRIAEQLRAANGKLHKQLETINHNVVIVIGRPNELGDVRFGEADLVIHIDADLKTAQIIKNVSGLSGHHARLFVDRHLTLDDMNDRLAAMHAAVVDAADDMQAHREKAVRLYDLLKGAWWIEAAGLIEELKR